MILFFEDFLEIKDPSPQVPAPARIHKSIVCEICREEVMATKIRLIQGKKVCIPCSEGALCFVLQQVE